MAEIKRQDEIHASVDELLRHPTTYPDRPNHVEVRETHISRVYLTDSKAYKLKKPVSFDFLDFSSPNLRRDACLNELRLNRRLAPDVYIDVVPITIDKSGRLRLNGSGAPVEWLVKMRRLADDRALSSMVAHSQLSAAEVSRIASKLAGFYEELPPVSMRPDEYRREILDHISGNREVLLQAPHHFAEDMVKRVHTAQLRLLHTRPQTFDERVCDGRIVEGHGDLRPEHIYMLTEPVVIDCIEFSTEFRTLDVVDELSFLAMECSYLGAEDIGERIFSHYSRTSGDNPTDQLRAFYMCYRACVRAKVHLLRSDQLETAAREAALLESSRYLRLADDVARRLGPPSVLIVRGLSGSGKTTLAEQLANILGAEHLQTDAIRRELWDDRVQPAAYDAGVYSQSSREEVYAELFERAGLMLRRGLSVVIDGAFLTQQSQREALQVAAAAGAAPILVNCVCPENVALERIVQRGREGASQSDAGPEVREKQREVEERPLAELPQCTVDTNCAPTMTCKTVLDAIAELPKTHEARAGWTLDRASR